MAPNTTPSAGRPAPGDLLRVRIDRIGARANAVAGVNGFTLFVPRGVVGEQAEVEVETVHARYAVARLNQILEPSPERIAPPCPAFSVCGGCDWLHVAYPEQLAYKRQVLCDQLARIGKLRTPPEDWRIVPCGQPLEYRGRLDFAVAWEQGRPVPGFHGVADTGPVAVEQCRLAPPIMTRLARAALEAVAQCVPALAKQPPRGAPGKLTRVSVQATAGGGGEALALALHLTDPAAAAALEECGEQLLAPLRTEFPTLHSVALAVRGRKGHRQRVRWTPLLGPPTLTMKAGGRSYGVPLAGFFQANAPQAALIIEAVTGLLAALDPETSGRAPLVLDLFCGVGLFSLPLARQGFRVVGVEQQRESVRAARETAEDWGLEGCTFEVGDLSLANVLQRAARKQGAPAAVLVNPPRAGLPRAVMEYLLAEAPPLVLYVSCDGATFARDAGRLAARYRLEHLQGFDMFPQTHHLEVLGAFRLLPE